MAIKDRVVELVLKARNMLSRDTDAAAGSVKEFSDNAKTLRDRLADLENQKGLVTQLQNSERATERAAEALRKAELRVVKLKEGMESSGTATEHQRRSLEAAEKAAAAAARHYRDSAAATHAYGVEARAAGINTNQLGKEQVRIGSESQKARRGLRAFGDEVDRSNGFMARFKANAAAVFAGMTAFAGLGAITRGIRRLGRATTGFFTGSIATAASFEEQLSRVRAVAQPTADEFEALRRAADEAGTTTKFTATESAQALEILAQAGLSAREAITTLPSVLNMAAAEGMELAQAAGYITDSLGIFQENVDEAGRFADVLAEASVAANTTISDLGDAMRDGGAAALAAGYDFEYTAAMLAAMSDSGLRGQRAGTGLRNILSQLIDPASKARRELAKLGITTEIGRAACRE